MRPVQVAVVQMHPQLVKPEDNLVKMSETIADICKAQKTDLIVFPELAVTGYECGVRFADMAQTIPGHVINLMAQRAMEYQVHLVFGLVVKEPVESILYDAAVLIGPDGELIGDYRKVHLRGEERMAFRPGFRYTVSDTAFGRVGLLIGWDLAFPEAARSLVLEGAELVCACANWENPHAAEWRAYVMARAYENSVFIAAANRVGEEVTYTFCGESMIVGPRGQVYASVDQGVEGYGIARLDLAEVKRAREEFQLIQYRQPLTYRSLVRKY